MEIETVEAMGKDLQVIDQLNDRIPYYHLPALELQDGTLITDAAACMAVIEAARPEPSLLGTDAKMKALISM